jgi:septal ring factor EnvC (AmiA/AmiB activator)
MIPGGAHQVVALNKQVMEELLRTQRSFCDTHSGNKVEIFCSECRMNICVACHAIKHKTHYCHDISDICRKFRQTLENDIIEITFKETIILQETKDIELKQKQFETKIQDIEQTIRRNAAELKKRVEEIVDELVSKLMENKTAALKTINEERSRLDVSLASLQSFRSHSLLN